MSSGERKGNLYVEDFDYYANTTGEWSPFLEFRVPASEWFLFRNDKRVHMFFPTVQTISHGGTGDETFSLDYKIVDSSALDDDETAYVDSSGDVTIDYSNNEITVNHDTDEDLDLYYIFGNGNVRLAYVPPFAQGSLRKHLIDKSFLSIHAVNQFSNNSAIYLSRAGLVPEKNKIQFWANTDATIEFPDNYNIGSVLLPYKARPRTEIPQGTESEIISSMLN